MIKNMCVLLSFSMMLVASNEFYVPSVETLEKIGREVQLSLGDQQALRWLDKRYPSGSALLNDLNLKRERNVSMDTENEEQVCNSRSQLLNRINTYTKLTQEQESSFPCAISGVLGAAGGLFFYW